MFCDVRIDVDIFIVWNLFMVVMRPFLHGLVSVLVLIKKALRDDHLDLVSTQVVTLLLLISYALWGDRVLIISQVLVNVVAGSNHEIKAFVAAVVTPTNAKLSCVLLPVEA